MPALGAHAPASWTCPQALSTASRRVQATPPDGCGRGTVAGPHSGGDRRPRGAVRPASRHTIAIRWLRHPVDAQPNAVPPPLERRHVDDEPKAHVAADHPFERFLDLIDWARRLLPVISSRRR